jgi:hypothetical protein
MDSAMALDFKELKTTSEKLPKTRIKEILEILNDKKFGTTDKKEIQKIIDQAKCDDDN